MALHVATSTFLVVSDKETPYPYFYSYSLRKVSLPSLRKTIMMGLIQGISICRNVPPIHHLMFADDCLIFARATVNDCSEIKRILNHYEEASGQHVNLQKSAVCFSRNVKREEQDRMATTLGVDLVDKHLSTSASPP